MHYLRKYWLHQVYVDNDDDDVADGHFYMQKICFLVHR